MSAALNKPGWQGRRVDRYQLVRRIGRGGMGEVYLAELEPMPGVTKLAAIKLLRDVGLEPGAERGFAAEARLAALISHPNVVQLLDAGVADEMPWLAMEFVAGLSLHELMVATRTRGGRLPPWIAARIIADACAGLHAVHEAKNERGEPLNIVHRDVTPHNVLIGWDGNVKITDFGVARSALQLTLTKTGTVKGKLAYMAPEQASGSRVDRRADVFALGILLWETLTAKKLFKAPNATETLARVLRCEVPPLTDYTPDAPPELASIAERALTRDPALRYATARELGRALEGAMRGAGIDLGQTEVAEVLATLIPERVREHEAWLREHDRNKAVQSSQIPVPAPSDATLMTLEAAESKTTVVRKRRPLLVLALALLVVTGAAVAAWARLRAPAPEPAAEPIASTPVLPVELRPAIAPPAASPTSAPPAASEPKVVARTPGKAAPAPQPAVREHGTLNVGSSPVWATVFVDGRSVGATPIAGLRLPAGAHVVEARAQGQAPQRRGVKVPANGSASVHFRFQPK